MPSKNGKYFYLSYRVDKNKPSVLYYKENLNDLGKPLVDPYDVYKDPNVVLSGYFPSKNSRYLAFKISPNGSDRQEIKFKDFANKKYLDDVLTDVKFSNVAWNGDRGIFYKKNSNKEFFEKDSTYQLYYHKIGDIQSKDQLVFDTSKSKANFIFFTKQNKLFVVETSEEAPAGAAVNTLPPRTRASRMKVARDRAHEQSLADIRASGLGPNAIEVANAPSGSSEDSNEAPLPANYPYRTRMRRAEYERLKAELQIELLKVQSWVKETGQRVVILVDEYDKPMLQSIGNEELQNEYRNTLKAFYSVMKTQDRYIRFGFLTGVTKFGKVSVFSDLNNLIDLSMDRQFQTLCGMTDKEIHTYFEEPLHQIAENYGITYDEVCLRLKERYDGYRFRQNGTNLYNPFSLLNTFRSLEFGSYWFETGTPTYLVKLLKDNNFCLPDLTSEGVTAETLTDVESFKDNPIAVIYQSGYLTIKEYDEEFNIYRLGFPNKEVAEGFIKYLVPYYMPIKDSESVY